MGVTCLLYVFHEVIYAPGAGSSEVWDANSGDGILGV